MIGSWFYDVYNRITSFWWPGASTKTYSYDRYGNHTGLGFGVSSTNRITSSGYTYDAAGNLTARPGNTFQWDGEGRVKSVNNGAVATISYDGDGKRSVKTSSTETRLYFYDIFGNPFLESAPTQGSWLDGYVYFNGRHVWQNTTNGHFWRHADMLGTPRLRTTGTGGSLCGTYTEPFGGELSTCTTQPSSLDNYKFTGKERDVETGLDNFGARMYANALARFLSPDLVPGVPDNPQTMNRYRYALNNPLRFIDPNGLYERDVHFHLTMVLARAAGFTPSEASIIANANQGVDEDLATTPYLLPIQRRVFHSFGVPPPNTIIVDRAIRNRNLRQLGTGLHALQDSFSHEEYGDTLGQVPAGIGVVRGLYGSFGFTFSKERAARTDKTDTDKFRTVSAAEATFNALAQFNAARGGRPTITFGAIRDLVLQFAGARTELEKLSLLAKIGQMVEQREKSSKNER